MNDHISLLLQGYAAKRELVQLFQPEGLGLVNQARIATVVDESIPAIETGIKQTSRLFRENRCKHDATAARRWLFIMPQDWTWWVWLVTAWLLLVGLMGTPEAFLAALVLSIAQSVLFFARERTFKAFPVQLRFAYTLLLIICLFPPFRWIYWYPLSAPLLLSYLDTVWRRECFRSCHGIAQSRLRSICCVEHFCPDREYRIGHIVSLRPAVEPACAPLTHR